MNTEKRFPELDALRGIAVWMMVTYHLLFDLTYFYAWDIPIYDGGWRIFARSAATLFLLLVGTCFVISWERASTQRRLRHAERSAEHQRSTESRHVAALAQHDVFFLLYTKYFKRGLIIFAGGMLISLITYFIAPEAYVRFGILHLIGVSALLQPFFVRLKKWNLFLGLLMLFAWFSGRPSGAPLLSHLHTFTPSTPLLVLGLTPPASSLDYFPFLPWFPVILLGMGLGYVFYTPSRKSALERADSLPFPRLLLWSGKRSLWIYFLHQPLLLIGLSVMFGMPKV